MRRIVIAPDSFKGSAGAPEIAEAMGRGARRALAGQDTDVEIVLAPMADGGEGTLEALTRSGAGEFVEVDTQDALGRPIRAAYARRGKAAIVELARASGLPGVADVPSRPLDADTFGTGQLIRDALERGAEQVLLCVGGSASTDGGTGIMRALGARFLDADDAEIGRGGGALGRLARVDLDGLLPAARRASWRLACDVDNPLLGPRGAAAVFGPQKGASGRDVGTLENGLARLHGVLGSPLLPPGAGAAGGVAATLVPLLGAHLTPGARMVADVLGLPDAVSSADLVITGEGAFDEQSLAGKVVGTVCALARDAKVPVVVIAGRVDLDPERARAAGVAHATALARGPASLAELMRDAVPLAELAAGEVVALAAALSP